jgi:hypothetical protein
MLLMRVPGGFGAPAPGAPVPPGDVPDMSTGLYLHDQQSVLNNYTGTTTQMNNLVQSPGGVLPLYEGYPVAADSGSAPVFSFITGLGGTGQAMRAAYNGTASGQVVSINTLPKTSNIGGYDPDVSCVVLQFRFRISSGGQGAAVGWKWCEGWHSSGRTQVSLTEAGASFAGEPCFHVNPISVGNFGFQPVRPTWEDLNDGADHEMIWLYQTNTTYAGGGTSSRDGICRVWIDDTKIIDISAASAGITPPGGVKVWCTLDEVDEITDLPIYYYALSQYHNETFPAYDEDFDNILVKAFARTT